MPNARWTPIDTPDIEYRNSLTVLAFWENSVKNELRGIYTLNGKIYRREASKDYDRWFIFNGGE